MHGFATQGDGRAGLAGGQSGTNQLGKERFGRTWQENGISGQNGFVRTGPETQTVKTLNMPNFFHVILPGGPAARPPPSRQPRCGDKRQTSYFSRSSCVQIILTPNVESIPNHKHVFRTDSIMSLLTQGQHLDLAQVIRHYPRPNM